MTETFAVPDYDAYPVVRALLGARIVDGDVEVRWDDGSASALPGVWLREFSPDFGTIHPVTREQVIMLIDLPDDLRAAAVEVLPDGRLAVTWHPEGLVSHYHPGWLWRHRPEAPAGSDLPRRHQWQPGRARHTPLVRVEGGAIRAGDEAALGAWLTAIHVDGLSIVEHLPPDPDMVPEIPHRIGCLLNSNFGEIWEVESRPNADSNAYTSVALAAHNDLCTREYVPGLQFLFCLHNSCSGGDSIFVDGYAVAEQLRAESPADFEVLATVAVTFGTRNRDSDHRFHARVLELNAAGDLVTVRYTWWLRNPMSGDSATIKAFYAAFKRFQRLANDPGNQLQLRLRAGDMACFDNRRMLHGRTAFDPSTGRRWLRGCYSEREELESRLRMLARAERMRLIGPGAWPGPRAVA
jgi:gamma-butyrobetaine dioxygenase